MGNILFKYCLCFCLDVLHKTGLHVLQCALPVKFNVLLTLSNELAFNYSPRQAWGRMLYIC